MFYHIKGSEAPSEKGVLPFSGEQPETETLGAGPGSQSGPGFEPG